MKRSVFLFLILLLLSSTIISAQLGNVGEQIQGVSENLEGNVDKVKEFTEGDKWDFIGSQWKEFLLKNKAISGVNDFFTKIDIVFVVLFSLHWAISIEMLFVFMLWLFTGLSIYGYLFIFRNTYVRWGASFLGAVALAHAKVYYLISTAMYKLIFFKQNNWWSLATFVICITLLILYFMINKVISKKLQESRKLGEEHDRDLKLKELEAYNKGMQFRESN